MTAIFSKYSTYIFVNGKYHILIHISWMSVHGGPFDNKSLSVQVMAGRRPIVAWLISPHDIAILANIKFNASKRKL